MHEVIARWLAALMLSLLIQTLDPRSRGAGVVIDVIVRTVLISVMLDALRRAF